MRKNSIYVIEIITGLALLAAVIYISGKVWVPKKVNFPEVIEQIIVPLISPMASPTPSPTPRALTLAEMNKLYGPCVNVPVLIYHHVEPEEEAVKNKRTGLNVPPEMFEKQMDYLVAKKYSIISPKDLVDFFDSGTALPSKPVMITVDDGYTDIRTKAFPVIEKLGISMTVYLPTGLMENNGYLSWSQIQEMKTSGLVSFGNHTWSHKNVASGVEEVRFEMTTADTQLEERSLNQPKTFVYPYGYENKSTVKLLDEMGYKLAFTTVHGRVLCEKQRLSLPRIRIGNAPMSVFGL